MSQRVLMITTMAQGESFAATLGIRIGVPVDVCRTRKDALAALRRRDYVVMILDDCLAQADPDSADLLWRHSGLAVPLQTNFAIVGAERLAREVRAALDRREQEQALAMRAATSVLQSELKSTVTGLLLYSQMALDEAGVSPVLTDKLRRVVELAGNLRQRLDTPPQERR